MLSFAALINWLYLAGGVAVGMSYWPQLRLYWREPKTRQGIAIVTMWAVFRWLPEGSPADRKEGEP